MSLCCTYGDIDDAEKYYYEAWKEHKYDVSILVKLIGILEENGRYLEAAKYYPELIRGLYPWIDSKYPSLQEVSNLHPLKWKELINENDRNQTMNLYLDSWEGDIEKAKEPPLQEQDQAVVMHHLFYEGNKNEVEQVLDCYCEKQLVFMITKAKTNTDPDIRNKAEKCLKTISEKKNN